MQATVLRKGRLHVIPASQLVPGDIVEVAGDAKSHHHLLCFLVAVLPATKAIKIDISMLLERPGHGWRLQMTLHAVVLSVKELEKDASFANTDLSIVQV